MMSFRALLAAAPLLALAVAQNIAFTSTPAEAVAGESYNITWGGGDGSGATLTLRRGNPQDLHTVSTLADAVTNNYYVWTVPASLESGDDYAFQITQGQSDINYSGLFSVTGGAESSANTSTSATSAAASATAFTFDNSTTSITSVSGAIVTGTAAVRNSTFSSATLSSSSSTDTETGTFDFNGATSTSTHSSATRTPSSSSTSAPSNDASIRAGSSAALILGIVAAVMLH